MAWKHGTLTGYKNGCRCEYCAFAMSEYHRKYRETNLDKIREKDRKWRETNRDKIRESNRKWREANPHRMHELQRKWAEANPHKIRENNRKWRQANPDKLRERNRNYYVHKKQDKLLLQKLAELTSKKTVKKGKTK